MELSGWEASRRWHLVRRFVYYLVEDFVPPDWATGRRVVDFSGGLGDFSTYLLESGAEQVTATVPEPGRQRPPSLPEEVEWRSGVTAASISEAFAPASVDLFCARMVLQFPTWEGDRADPDSMLAAIATALSPGGTVVLAVHDYFPLHPPGLGHDHDVAQHLDRVEELALEVLADPTTGTLARAEAERLRGLVEMVRFLGLPPREGPLGETGFGLKVPMLVESLLRAGLEVEHAEHVEPFTFPVGLERRLEEDDGLELLGDRVFEVKRRAFGETTIDPYERPGLIRRVVEEVGRLTRVVTVPIVRVSGRRR